jgi:hypothetical protein
MENLDGTLGQLLNTIDATSATSTQPTANEFPTRLNFSHMPILFRKYPQEATIIAAEALTEALKRKQPPQNLATLLEPAKAALQQLQQYIHPSSTIEATADQSPTVREPPRVDPFVNDEPNTATTHEPIAK